MSINPLSVFFIPALVLAIILGFVLGRQGKTSNTVVPQNKQITSIPSPTPTITSTATPIFFVSPTPQKPKTNNYSDFIYPGSETIDISVNKITLESSDDTNTITNWYKDKIKSMGINAQAFSQTNTNGNILNKLAGANSTRKIEVTITKLANQEKTTIHLNLKN